MSLARWTALEKDALNAASDSTISPISYPTSDRGKLSRTLARLLRDLVQYANHFRADVSLLEALPTRRPLPPRRR